MTEYLIYFITGGTVTTVIIAFQNSDSRLISGFATLMPVFTLVAYFFLGQSKGGAVLAQHAWMVLLGTIVSWVPYMVTVAVLAPKIGSNKAILVGLGVFFVLAVIYLGLVGMFGLFRVQ